ncbi:hypothetical protein [Pararhizobium qamdonense]|uniref:hypothetical protein n=1 Tax=Pararhizobium qamdonense TaxID=3031126 RepID=UPI0023E16EE6|nr:hypothetical protein [Pararhizobium qamdonense]
MTLKPKLDDLCLIDAGVLARVTRLDDEGFDFLCVNGAWNGRFAFEGGIVSVEGAETFPGRTITCVDQPPKEIAKDGYNAIIPWMSERVSESKKVEPVIAAVLKPASGLPPVNWRPLKGRKTTANSLSPAPKSTRQPTPFERGTATKR